MRTTEKLAALTLLTALLTGSAAALSVQYSPNTTTVEPSTTQQIGQFTLAARNETISLTNIITNLPFNATFQPSSFTLNASCQPNTSCSYQNRTVNVSVFVPSGFSPGTYTASTIFVFADRHRIETPLQVTVPKDRSWRITDVKTLQNLSVGTETRYGSITIRNDGNVDTRLHLNASGNLSNYLLFNRQDTVLPGFNRTITLKADVPKTTSFGNYTGQLTITSQTKTRVLNLSTYFRDTIPPQIRRVEAPDLMATTEQLFHVVTTDNLDVANVSGVIYRPVKVQQGNTTKVVNRSLRQVTFEQGDRADVWTYPLRQTSQRGVYYLNVTVEDTAGNTATATAGFRIRRLNASHVLASNFIFDRVQPRDQAVKPVLRNEIRTPVTLTLERWQHSVNSSGIWIGVRKPGDEVPVKFEGEGDSITVRQQGVYELVVESDTAESYQGRISVEPVEEHVPLPPIVFSGKTDLQYPSQETFSLKGLTTHIEVYQNESTGEEYVKMVTRAPAEKCQGVSTWRECIETRSPGTIRQVRHRVEEALASKRRAWMVAGLTVLLALVFVGYSVKERSLQGKFKYLYAPEHDEVHSNSFNHE